MSRTATAGLVRCWIGCALGLLLAFGPGAAASSQEAQAKIEGVALPDAPDPQGQFQAAQQKAAAGQIMGVVVDADLEIVPGAQVTLVTAGTTQVRTASGDENGVFRFTGVPAGEFTVKASYPRMTSGTFVGVLHTGESMQALPIRLNATESESVQVMASQEELASAELHVEEQQRLFGIMPNFYTVYDWHAAPLTRKQKFQLAWKNVIDPGSFFVIGATAGIEQAENAFSGYNQGAAGFGRRYGAAAGDLVSGTYLGGAILPAIFHQDPRYFYKGTGSVTSRALYAVTRAFVCRGDNGRSQVNYSGMLGDLSAGALANTYYPATNRQGAALTFEEGGLNILGDAAGNLVQEFALKRLTPHAPSYPSAHIPSPGGAPGSNPAPR